MTARTARIVLAAGVAGWIANAVIQWGMSPILGHDEAQYAIAAQDLLDGEKVRWSYLSVGMSFVAMPGVLAGGGEGALRLLPVLAGIGFVLVVARLAREVLGGGAAAWAVAVLVGSRSFVKPAADLLSDLPAAALLIGGTAIVVGELTRDVPRRRLLLAAPCFAGAFYLRYGSLLPIGATGAIALVVGWRAVRRRPWLVVGTIALLAVLLVPFVGLSVAVTGEPLGILRDSSLVLGDEGYMGKSLVTYVTANPFWYYGIATTPALVAGLVAIRRARDRRILMLWLIAVGDIIVIGLTPIPQVRYIFFGLALLVILGVDEIDRWAGGRSQRVRRGVGVVAVAVLAVSWISVMVGSVRSGGARDRRQAGTLAAIEAIREDAKGASCLVIGRHTTQLQWYTGCVAVYDAPADELRRKRVYVVQEPGGKYQPELAGHVGVPRAIVNRPGVLIVTRLDPP